MSPAPAPARALDVTAIRADFPILHRQVNGRRLAYLDSAATTQKPKQVLDAIVSFYSEHNANIHRGVHTLAEEATALYEGSRERVARFLGHDPKGVVFTRGTTESINLVAHAWARPLLKPGDEIVISIMEHHSNFVPWIEAAKATGATLKHARLTADGRLDLDHLAELVTPRTKLVAITHVSNVMGTVVPVLDVSKIAKRHGAKLLVDGAQSVPHLPLPHAFDELGCDFLAFSAHKMLGPTGVGVLAADPAILQQMQPFNTGGSMIRTVKPDSATWNDVPWKFEAGTPNIADTVAFTAALDYLGRIGLPAIRAHEIELTRYALEQLAKLPSIKVHGPAKAEDRGGVISFSDADLHPHDLATILDRAGVAIRAGHHCAQPLMKVLDVVATARASFYLYNDHDDVDALIAGLHEARKYFKLA